MLDKLLIIILFILIVLDTHSTYLAVYKTKKTRWGEVKEGNPLLRFLFNRIGFVKTNIFKFIFVLIILYIFWVAPFSLFKVLVLVVLVMWFSGITINNYRWYKLWKVK